MKGEKMIKIGFVLFMFLIFIGARAEHLWGETNTESSEKAMDKEYMIQECHKWFAVELNILTWNLLEKEARTEEEDETMIHAAHASCYHWGIVGTAVNLQRGEWLISRVYAVLNRPEPALYHAKKCLELTVKYNFEDFDLAYAYEAIARAYASASEKAEFEKYYSLAKEAGEKIKEKEDRDLFFSDFESEPWHNIK